MAQLQSIKDTFAEQRLFLGRLLAAVVFVLLASGAVVARLTQLQVIEHEHYADLSKGNRIRIEAAPPTRGLILDRNGNVLAQNLPAYQLEVIPEQVDDIDAALTELVRAELIDEDALPDLRSRIRMSPSFNPVTLAERLSDDDIARFTRLRPFMQGIDIRARLVRDYPHGSLAAHVLGYVGRVSRSDMDRIDIANYAGTAQIGKTGIELTYESVLHGTVGHNEVVTTAEGRARSYEPRDEPQPGRNVHLTLDLELQRRAESLLVGQRGAIVAVDPATGEVLAMASAPSFDPNAFARGMGTDDFTALQSDLDRPLFNRAISGQYPPGSTIKPILGYAALTSGRTAPGRVTHCGGFFTLPGSTHRYRDWKPEGHGTVDLNDAIAQSCDVYFYELAQDMDIDLMHDFLVQFGLGEPLGIEIPGEKSGLVPSRSWKRSAFSRRADQVWFPGETVIASIGQGYMLATPLQLAHATAAVAMRGQRVRPHLTLRLEDRISAESERPTLEIQPAVGQTDDSAWTHVIDAMRNVLQSPRGSAFAAGRTADYLFAGKSGTAQVFSVAQEDEYDEAELDLRLRDHALFVSFAPADNPRIAIAVIVENGSSGSSVAAPIAREMTDAWLVR